VVTKQTEYNRLRELQRLQRLIPHDCPLLVSRDANGYELVTRSLDGIELFRGRYFVIVAHITGFVQGWRRVGQTPTAP